MREVKDTQRSTVRLGFDGKVHKTFRGPQARERFENEVHVLRYLQEKACPFVPELISVDAESFYMVTTNCGARAEDSISEKRTQELYQELEDGFGVRHDDPFSRNITYDARKGRFCVIDFEYAIILETGEGLKQPEARTDHERKQ
ncbi:MAG: putative Ser/Thr protein kinase [Candidatus Pelagisphaera sp.]|jgi:predicted Ser/Thr protein kinase